MDLVKTTNCKLKVGQGTAQRGTRYMVKQERKGRKKKVKHFRWRCQRYGPLGWMETVVKALAIGVGIASLSIYSRAERTLKTLRIVQIVFMAIIGAVLVAMIVQRILDKELFALGFIVVNVIGHWIMVLILILSRDPGAFIFTYAFLMVLGEFIKICFLFLAENIEVKFLTKPILFALSGFFVIFYIIIIILQVVTWLTQFDPS